MPRASEDVLYYRKMECVVNRTMIRLMENVIKDRPSSSKEVLTVIGEVVRKNLKGFAEGKGWLCGACAYPNTAEASTCSSCRAGKNDPIPTEQVGDGPLLIALRHELAKREAALEEREQAVADKEKELGIVTTAPTSKVKAKAANETPSRFGDGADLLPSQEKVPEKPVLLPPGYAPPKVAASPDGKGVLSYLATWKDAKGCEMWNSDTISDFCMDADFLVAADKKKGRSGNEPAMVVRSLYAYTHSQLGPRFFWAVWVPAVQELEEDEPTPAKWEPLFATSGQLELIHTKGTLTHIPATGELCSALSVAKESAPKDGIEVKKLMALEKVGLDAWAAPGGVFLVRYENKLRGHRAYSPLRDTVAYLPSGDKLESGLLHDKPKESVLPFSGVLEYIAANTPDSQLHGGAEKNKEGEKLPPVWTCQPFTDPAITQLIEECMEQPNQQKADKDLHDKALKILTKQAVKRQEGFPDISVKLFAAVFKKSCNYQDGVLLTPEEIGRAFTMQCLMWQGKHFLLTLSTTTVETRTPHILGYLEKEEVIPVFRLVTNFWPQQIFYLLNLSMRETQFGNSDAELTIPGTPETYANGTVGKYFSAQPATWVEELDGKAKTPEFYRRDKGMFGTAHSVCVSWDDDAWKVVFPLGRVERVEEGTWVSPKAWMLPQVRPLIYFTNKALNAVQESMDVDALKKTYRGISCSLSREVYSTGRVLVWAQYSSTSEDQGVAAAFAKGEKPAAVFTMHGKTCVAVKPYSRFAREAEMLYRNNTCFRVTESLTKEQAQILGKENLQLFTLEEVTEVEMHCILVRRMLPFAKSTAAASVVFQAEAALKGNKCLELSISTTTDGAVPPKWQMFLEEASLGCPVDGSTAWTNPAIDSAKLDKIHDVWKSLQAVGRNETPHHTLYFADVPEGRHATLGLKSIKLSAQGLSDAHGTYKLEEDSQTCFNIINDEDFSIRYEEGKWRFEYDGNEQEESIMFESDQLLGEWPAQKKISGPVIKPVQVTNSNILQPRCNEEHPLSVDKATDEERICAQCDEAITANKLLACRKCDTYYHRNCLQSISWDDITLKVEDNTLVKYVDGEIACPQITKLTVVGEELVDQRGTKTSLPSEWHFMSLARLCAETFVEHNLPLTKEPSLPSTDVISIIREIVQNDDVNTVRIFGRKGKTDKVKLKIGVEGEKAWCIDLELRQTDARPGLAIGDDGALMASRIVGLGVPLEVVGLRNNCVGLEGAKLLLESVRENPNVIEATIGDDGMQDKEMEVFTKALSIRCMFHRCKNRQEQLLDDHLSGMGERWPEIFSLALHDVKKIKLPVGAILDQHPEGWKKMCKLFTTKPKPTKDVLHNACKYGRVRAIKPILDDCNVDPNIRDKAGKSALFLAVRQPAFESEEGKAAIGRLVTEEMKQEGSMALRSAVEVCGPKVTGELLKQGLTSEDFGELLVLAVKNKLFEKGTDVLNQLVSKVSDTEKSAALVAAASVEGGGSFIIMDELIKAKADIKHTETDGGMTPLHIVAAYKELLSEEAKVVVKKMVSEEVLLMKGNGDETPLLVSMGGTPEMVSFLLQNGAKLPEDEGEQNKLMLTACGNEKFNNAGGLDVLKKLFAKGNKDVESLCTACQLGHPVLANYLIENGTPMDEEGGDEGELPIFLCCRSTFDWGSSDEGKKTLDSLTKDTLEKTDWEDMTPLARAISSGLVYTAEYLIDKGADLESKSDEGWTMAFHLARSPMFESTEKGIEVVHRIITGENVNNLMGYEQPEEGEEADFSGAVTPMMIAAALGRVKLCKILLDLGAEVECKFTTDTSILGFASGNPAFGQELELFERFITDTNVNKPVDDETPLTIAINKCNFKVIPILLKHGATGEDVISGICTNEAFDSPEGVEVARALINKDNVNTQIDGETPLYKALAWGLLLIASYLLDAGASPETSGEDCESMLVEACNTQQFNTPEGRQLLSKLITKKNINEQNGEPLRMAASNGYLELVEELLDQGADVTLVSDDSNRTVLMEAALTTEWNTIEGARLLKRIFKMSKKNVADLINVQDSNHDTCLHDACTYGMFSVLDVTLKVATPEALALQNKDFKTPLHLICDSHATTQIQMQVMRRLAVLPQLEMQDGDGHTPLHIACMEGGQGPFDLLLDCGASVKATNQKKRTALHVAVEGDISLACVKALLKNDAKPNAKDSEGNTPLQVLLHRPRDKSNAKEAAEILHEVTTEPLKKGTVVRMQELREVLGLEEDEFKAADGNEGEDEDEDEDIPDVGDLDLDLEEEDEDADADWDEDSW